MVGRKFLFSFGSLYRTLVRRDKFNFFCSCPAGRPDRRCPVRNKRTCRSSKLLDNDVPNMKEMKNSLDNFASSYINYMKASLIICIFLMRDSHCGYLYQKMRKKIMFFSLINHFDYEFYLCPFWLIIFLSSFLYFLFDIFCTCFIFRNYF